MPNMSDVKPADAIDRVEAWLLERKPELQRIDRDLDLIDTRVLDSLQFTDFLLLLEETTGREIAVAEITVDAFRTLGAIERNFIRPSA
jgi:acyl carrier protein